MKAQIERMQALKEKAELEEKFKNFSNYFNMDFSPLTSNKGTNKSTAAIKVPVINQTTHTMAVVNDVNKVINSNDTNKVIKSNDANKVINPRKRTFSENSARAEANIARAQQPAKQTGKNQPAITAYDATVVEMTNFLDIHVGRNHFILKW